jgi:hypothetical protein
MLTNEQHVIKMITGNQINYKLYLIIINKFLQ